MARTIFLTASTLNGFLADEHDSLDWLFAVPGDDNGGNEFERFLDGVGVLVQGSSTYEWVVEHEDLLARPEKWPGYHAGRLDELRVTFAPATLAAGRPLLPRDLGADRLALVDAERRGAFAELRYTVSAS